MQSNELKQDGIEKVWIMVRKHSRLVSIYKYSNDQWKKLHVCEYVS